MAVRVRSNGRWIFVLCIAAATAVACGGGDPRPGGDAGQPQGGSGGGQISQGGQGGQGGSAGEVVIPPGCGDGVVNSEVEECDDGDTDDTNGCTIMCTFTCKQDSDCDDLDICNGNETCNTNDHVCLPGSPAEDGTRCGTAMSCQNGICVADSCGDGLLQEDEECDDGDNYDENDGCTTRCTFSCVSDDAARNCVNACNPTSVCDDATHTCTAGDPLPENAVCNDGAGYCVNGVCVASTCGDGNQEPNEQCDLGGENGTAGADCTAECTLGSCGNAIIEGMEQCDDGNSDNADGCDAKCRVEIVYRLTRLEISLDPAPDFCTFANNDKQGNAFSGLFTGNIFSNAMYTTMRDMMGQVFLDGTANTLIHVMDMEDPSANTPDPLINLGLSMGSLAADWASQTDKLDFPVTINTIDVDDQNLPLTRNPAELVIESGKTFLRSTSPQSVFFRSPGGDFILYGAMTEFEIDAPRSRLTPPPETAEAVTIPETLGQDYSDVAQGVICGAMPAESFATIPMPAALALLCPLNFFVACAEGQDPTTGVCDSIEDLLVQGCAPLLSPAGEPDADTDGDGVPDAFSSLVKASAKRVRLVGVADPPQ